MQNDVAILLAATLLFFACRDNGKQLEMFPKLRGQKPYASLHASNGERYMQPTHTKGNDWKPAYRAHSLKANKIGCAYLKLAVFHVCQVRLSASRLRARASQSKSLPLILLLRSTRLNARGCGCAPPLVAMTRGGAAMKQDGADARRSSQMSPTPI
eukprot:6194746-Pleurochrysis_carterae.AAC.1